MAVRFFDCPIDKDRIDRVGDGLDRAHCPRIDRCDDRFFCLASVSALHDRRTECADNRADCIWRDGRILFTCQPRVLAGRSSCRLCAVNCADVDDLDFHLPLFIPNNWQRAAVVIGTMALVPILLMIGVQVTQSAVATPSITGALYLQNGSIENVLALLLSTAIAIWACLWSTRCVWRFSKPSSLASTSFANASALVVWVSLSCRTCDAKTQMRYQSHSPR